MLTVERFDFPRSGRYGLAATALTLLLAFTAPLSAQTADTAQKTPPPLAFDVATVKPVDTSHINTVELRVYPGGRLVIHTQPLSMLVADAFDVPWDEVIGTGSKITEKRFNIEAVPPPDLRSKIQEGEYSNLGIRSPEERGMLQSLLIERFHLRYHWEKQPGTVYLLERGAGPLKLEPAKINLYTKSDNGDFTPTQSYPTGDLGMAAGHVVSFDMATMHQLAFALTREEEAPVIDETGLQGYYNFTSKTVVTEEDFKDRSVFHMYTATVPEMGLKLVKTTGTVEKLVVDSWETPDAN
ncbi:TIGR03435 family protein [Silvibacterium sp.]|uniref:TIGR03435 family protein n=1 Tax=Silvibacterium sp. TaxID=1964179 RepID=UPI0039E69C03